jgi:hypothetical protein
MSNRFRGNLSEESSSRKGEKDEDHEHRILKIENGMILMKGQLETIINLLSNPKKRNSSSSRNSVEDFGTSEESSSETLSTTKSKSKKVSKEQEEEDYRWIHKPVDLEFRDNLDLIKGPIIFRKLISSSKKDYVFLQNIMYCFCSFVWQSNYIDFCTGNCEIRILMRIRSRFWILFTK